MPTRRCTSGFWRIAAAKAANSRIRALFALIGLAAAALLAGCAHMSQQGSVASTPLRAMTYNIRLDLESDGANSWPNRKDMVAQLVRHEAPDVLGMQEVLLSQKRDLEATLPDYAFAGVGRDDGAEAGEFSPVGWRRDRFELLDTGTFWLSPTPSLPGKAWDADYPRIATWAVLHDRSSGMRLHVLNTHFDHVGGVARERSAGLIADWSTERVRQGAHVIVMGDFNAESGSPPIALLADRARSALRESGSASRSGHYGPPGTFNGFRIDAAAAPVIDHIFVSDGIEVLRHATITQHWEGRLPSDHYPVVADLELPAH